MAKIRPQEAGVILVDLTLSEDEEIVEAVHDAMTMAETLSDDVFNDDEHIH